ncbi:hypothetical protein DIPPA_25512, partial [Diplonema papillatum]
THSGSSRVQFAKYKSAKNFCLPKGYIPVLLSVTWQLLSKQRFKRTTPELRNLFLKIERTGYNTHSGSSRVKFAKYKSAKNFCLPKGYIPVLLSVTWQLLSKTEVQTHHSGVEEFVPQNRENRIQHTHSGSSRGLAVRLVAKGETRENVMRREYLEELYGIDGGIIDFSPTATPLTEALFNCSSLPASQCGFQFGHPFCMFHAASGTCAYVDSVGLAPSYLHKAAVTVEYKGVQWGMREMCTEAPLPPRVASNQTTVLTEVRGPCEAHFTPMDCFSEFPRSHPPLDLVLLKWPQNHQHSVADETSYGQALAEPCRFWSGGFNPKGNTLGGMRYNASSGEVVHVSAYQMLYGIAEKHGFVNK